MTTKRFRRQSEQDAYRLLHTEGLSALERAYPIEAIPMVNDWSEKGLCQATWKWDGTYEEPNSRGIRAKRICFTVQTFKKYLSPDCVG